MSAVHARSCSPTAIAARGTLASPHKRTKHTAVRTRSWECGIMPAIELDNHMLRHLAGVRCRPTWLQKYVVADKDMEGCLSTSANLLPHAHFAFLT